MHIGKAGGLELLLNQLDRQLLLRLGGLTGIRSSRRIGLLRARDPDKGGEQSHGNQGAHVSLLEAPGRNPISARTFLCRLGESGETELFQWAGSHAAKA